MLNSSPDIKICGVCSVSDAQMAITYGAKYLGLIFVQSSPRHMDPVTARSIIDSCDRQQIKVVGVFQNSPLEELENIASSVGFDYFQLHGNESPAVCSILSRPVIKAFQVADKELAEQPCITLSFAGIEPGQDIDDNLAILEQYRPYCRHFLFDKSKDNQKSNWLDFVGEQLQLIEQELGEYFLGGGLNADNVETVLQRLRPSVVDIASGIEEAPGIKSKVLMAEFCSKVHASRTIPLSSQLGADQK